MPATVIAERIGWTHGMTVLRHPSARLEDQTPALMHLHSLVWLAAAVVALAFLYRGLIGATWAAGLAALL